MPLHKTEHEHPQGSDPVIASTEDIHLFLCALSSRMQLLPKPNYIIAYYL